MSTLASSKKCLVTGAGGFIGSHLCETLVTQGFQVRALTRYNSKSNWGWLESSPFLKEIEVISGDLRDFDSVDRAVQGNDYVFHLGALIGIPYSYTSPLAYIKTNVEGTYNVLESCRKHSVARTITLSTSEVYGTARSVPMNESHVLQPQSPYSASKIGADNMALSYFNAFKMPVVVARPFNTFGPRQSARAIIPSIIIQLLNKRDQIQLGNLAPERDLTFVTDTCDALVRIAETSSLVGEAFNIGTGSAISVGNLVQLLQDQLGVKIPVVQDSQRVRPATSEVDRLVCDSTKLMKKTGWSPKNDFKEGLKKTLHWFESNLGLYKSEIYHV